MICLKLDSHFTIMPLVGMDYCTILDACGGLSKLSSMTTKTTGTYITRAVAVMYIRHSQSLPRLGGTLNILSFSLIAQDLHSFTDNVFIILIDSCSDLSHLAPFQCRSCPSFGPSQTRWGACTIFLRGTFSHVWLISSVVQSYFRRFI